MIGRIKIFSKAIMINRTLHLTLIMIISGALMLLSNNLFLAGNYIFDLLKQTNLSIFSSPEMSKFGLLTVYSLIAVISLMMVIPLKLSGEVWFYESAKRNKPLLRKIFFSYKPFYFVKSILLSVSIFFIKLFWALMYCLPSIAFASYLYYCLQSGISKTMFYLISSATVLSLSCGLYFSFVTFQRYSLSYILLYENESAGIFEIIHLSTALMDKKCFDLAKLKLSFSLWFFLCPLVIPIFYIYPYYKLSVSYFLNKILCEGS